METEKTSFVYVTYIRSTPEKVFEAIAQPEIARRYWGHENISDWKPGSRWEHVRSDGSGKVDILGKVLEFEPPRRMEWSWASPEGAGVAERSSRVTYELTALGSETRLVVTHSELQAGSEMLAGISKGWPAVLSNLKSLLETGEPMSERIWDKADA